MKRRGGCARDFVGSAPYSFFFVPLVSFVPFVLKPPVQQSACPKHLRTKPISLDKLPRPEDTARILSGPPDPVLTVLADIPALAKTDQGGRAAQRARPPA